MEDEKGDAGGEDEQLEQEEEEKEEGRGERGGHLRRGNQ